MASTLYLIGSLRNQQIPIIAEEFRAAGYDVFDDWFASGPDADDHWRNYEKGRGRSYTQALKESKSGFTQFHFDRSNLDTVDVVVLALPAGKSAHLELGWHLRSGKPGYILLDNPERWELMYKLATGVYERVDDIIEAEQARQRGHR